MISYVTGFLSVLCLVETGVTGDARLCTVEFNGETKYIVCPRTEYCCKLGCCISPSFQFYQLWYYWLMVIFMLVVCSGGQWWYKYWVEGGERSGGPPSVMVRNRGNTSTAQPPPRPRIGVMPSTAAPPSASTSSSLPTSFTLIHQICKPHHYHSRGDGKAPSPYDQIYGPPPSYESVFGNRPSSVLPAYTVTPELVVGPTNREHEGDPLGAVDFAPIRGHCPSYSQSQLDQQNEPETTTTAAVEPSTTSNPAAQESNSNVNVGTNVSPEDASSNHETVVNTVNEITPRVQDTASATQTDSLPASTTDSLPASTTDSTAQTYRSQCPEHAHH